MNIYVLAEDLYLYPTPAGAYFAVSSIKNSKPRSFLLRLLQQPQTPALTLENLMQLMDSRQESYCFELLDYCQEAGLVQGLATPLELPELPLEQLLPDYLSKLSREGSILLADQEGLNLAAYRFDPATADQLSALSAELEQFQKRHQHLIPEFLAGQPGAWALVNEWGGSRIGFWPIFINKNRFALAVSGTPHFNQPEFVLLAWILINRYDEATQLI